MKYFQIYLSMWVSLWDAVVTNVVLNLEVRVCVWVFWQLATLFSMHLRTHSVFPCHTDARSMHICMHAYTSIGTNTCPLLNCKHKEMLICDGSGGGGGGDDGCCAISSGSGSSNIGVLQVYCIHTVYVIHSNSCSMCLASIIIIVVVVVAAVVNIVTELNALCRRYVRRFKCFHALVIRVRLCGKHRFVTRTELLDFDAI